MYGILDDPTKATLRAAMNACAIRNRVIANNIANADTPGYKRRYVQFEELLTQELENPTATSQSILSVKPGIAVENTPSSRLDGNNINLDMEMADLARNSIEYNALIDLNRLKSNLMSTVINGGK